MIEMLAERLFHPGAEFHFIVVNRPHCDRAHHRRSSCCRSWLAADHVASGIKVYFFLPSMERALVQTVLTAAGSFLVCTLGLP